MDSKSSKTNTKAKIGTRAGIKPATKKGKSAKKSPHDELLKKVMESPIAVREFLEEYLPTSFKEKLDLSSAKLEKESYIESSLRKKLSDIVISVKTKDNEEAFIYTLLENQSSSDYWIAFRLLKYSMLLLEGHMDKKKEKLPLVCNIVLYNGKSAYRAPRSFWELFENPLLAKELMGDEYRLVDLQAMSEDEILKKEHLGILEFFLKNIHMRDKIKLWEEFFKKCRKMVLIDKKNDYVYMRSIIWYTDNKVPAEKKESLEKMIIDNLPDEDRGKIMRTIADVYKEEWIDQGISIGEQRGISIGEQRGISIGKQEGISIGEQRGISIGEQKGIEKTAINLLKTKADMNFISSVTGLSTEDLLKLKAKI